MKKTWYVGVIVTSFICFLCLSWKIWTLLNREIEVYSRIEAQKKANSRLVTQCKGFGERNDLHNANTKENVRELCEPGFVLKNRACVICPQGTFSFPGWMSCSNYLGCEEIRYDVRVNEDLFSAGLWQFKSAEWNGYQVLLAEMRGKALVSDKEIVRQVTQNLTILKPIGFCVQSGNIAFAQSSVVKSSADKLASLFAYNSECDTWIVRFRLAIDFVQTLSQLHSARDGPVVFCNSQSVEQVLQQLAVTENWELFLASFDNLPQRRNSSLVVCSSEELKDDLVAPEQRWPYPGTKVFNIDLQPGYTEAADVWKIPDVTTALLGSSLKARRVLDYLSAIHLQCKKEAPESRPSAAFVLSHYKELWDLLVNYY